MSKSPQSFNKKEKEKKRRKKQKEKLEKREQRKLDKLEAGKKSFEDMLMYVDEDGNLTSTPPDPTKKRKKVKLEDIILGHPPREKVIVETVRKGIVKFFNHEKGYGFINDLSSDDSIFVHINNTLEEITENDKVTFEVEMGMKGPNAVKVQVIKD